MAINPSAVRFVPEPRGSGKRQESATCAPCSVFCACPAIAIRAADGRSAIPIASFVTLITCDKQAWVLLSTWDTPKLEAPKMLRIILAGAVPFAALVLSLQPAGRGALVRRNVGRRWRHALGLPLSLDRRMPAERAG